jgi:ATP-dependent DNA ligase
MKMRVSPDVFSKALNVPSNRANADTRMWRPGTATGMFRCHSPNDHEDVEIDLSRYWVSEKYDGVRACWDGSQLLSRAGNVIHAPAWFTARLPTTPLDGELWAGRGRFETGLKVENWA